MIIHEILTLKNALQFNLMILNLKKQMILFQNSEYSSCQASIKLQPTVNRTYFCFELSKDLISPGS